MSIRVVRSDARTGEKEITNDAELSAQYWLEVQFTDTDRSHVRVIMLAGSFKKLAQAMMRVDSEEAIKAFGAAMQAGIRPKPKL